MNLIFTKHTTDGLFLLQDRKVSICMLFQKFCLDWKLSPIINRWGVGIRMSWVEKNITQEVAFRHLSVRFLSITFQSFFGSAEFGKRLMQCAKRKTSHYTQSSLWVIFIYTYKVETLKKPWKKVDDGLVDHLYFINLNAFLLVLTWSLFSPLNSNL